MEMVVTVPGSFLTATKSLIKFIMDYKELIISGLLQYSSASTSVRLLAFRIGMLIEKFPSCVLIF